jgi:anti-sigma regulatory factor (Ser/Thr protein kinase)
MASDRESQAVGRADRSPAQSGSLPLEQDFDAASLYALRSAVAAHADAAGLSSRRVYDITAVAHELAANAVMHGAGHGRLRLWTDGGFLYCQVSDDGPGGGAGQPASGAVPWPVVYSHGLWLVGQVADRFRIDRGPAGTTVTARFALGPTGPANEPPAA